MEVQNFFLALALLTANSQAQLLSTASDVSDGVCNFPSKMATNTKVLDLYSPLKNYYMPVASKSFFRAEVEVLLNRPANNESEITALKTRVQMLRPNSLLLAGDLGCTFYGGNKANFAYRCLPSSMLNIHKDNLLSPLLNVTCSVVGGSAGVASAASVGKIYYTVIWSDKTAVTIWGCIKGVQSFHIMSVNPTLTPSQRQINVDLLTKLGFKEENFQDMIYD